MILACMYVIVDNPVEAAHNLNSDMEKVNQWTKTWLVTFNPSKSEYLLFSRKINKSQHPHITMNNETIPEVNHHKHLGLIFSGDCTWHEHLAQIKTKAWQRINIMRKLKFTPDRKSLETIYFSFVRPLLEYADVVWDNCTQHEVNELEKFQLEASRIATGATRLVSLNLLYSDTGWETLASRRNKHKLVLFYKMYSVSSNISHNLRNPNNIQTIHARTQLYYNSFLPSVIRSWNGLAEDVRNCNSTASFKHRLNTNLKPPPRYYFVGKRLGQILHTRLRSNCSSLKQHLFSKNIVQSPLCACGNIENTEHFLLHCPIYHNLRQDMTRSISHMCRPSINIFLYGDPNLSYNDNMLIFITVQDFLLKTKRFEPNR